MNRDPNDVQELVPGVGWSFPTASLSIDPVYAACGVYQPIVTDTELPYKAMKVLRKSELGMN